MKRKVIRVTLTLKDGKEVFVSGKNKLTSEELAVSCNFAYGNGAVTPTAQITIFGLPLEKMMKLMRLQWNTMDSLLNMVRIEAGNEGEDLQLVYDGNITQATIDMNQAPTPPLIITSQMAVYEKAKVMPPYTSPKGVSINIADLVSQLCAEIEYTFENNGVDNVGVDITLEGSNIEKIQKLANIFDFDLYVEQKSVTICKLGEPRLTKIPVISPSSGLIGYPVPDVKGVNFSCLYDPLVKFGGIVRIENSVLGDLVNRDWRIYGYTAQLEAYVQNGKWQIDAQATWRDSKDIAMGRK